MARNVRVNDGSGRTVTDGDLSAAAGVRGFVIFSLIYLAAAVVVAVLHGTTATVLRGWWLVAFLSLVGGVAQLLLGPGLLALARRRDAPLPGASSMWAELVLWNGGTAAVAAADLASSMAGVVAGSVLLLIALALFAGGLARIRTTARRASAAWMGAYIFLLLFLAVSVGVGVFLAYMRGQ